MRTITFLAVIVCLPVSSLDAFFPVRASTSLKRFTTVRISLTEDDIDRELARARQLIAEAKAKLDAIEGEPVEGPVVEERQIPFFAKLVSGSNTIPVRDKREVVVKSENQDGLITVNGEEMAKLSEGEDWTARPLGEVFENELTEEEDVYSLASRQLAERDVAASIRNLRKTMQTEDYKRIFDTKNRFIGEDV
jgi:hypothetical protein